MQAISFSTLPPRQDSLPGEHPEMMSSPQEKKTAASHALQTAGKQISHLLLKDSTDPLAQKLASRFSRGEFSSTALSQLDRYLGEHTSRHQPALSGVLSQVAEHQPALKGKVEELQASLRQRASRLNTSEKEPGVLTNALRDSISNKSDHRSLVIPNGFIPVSPQQAERSIQTVMNAPTMPMGKLLGMNIEALSLQAANLGIKTFSDTASAVTKSQSLATEARKTLMDKQVADFAKDLEKAIKQQENAKKGGIFGAIMKWIMPVISVVAMVFVPMSLPLMVGMIGATVASTASAAMNTASLVMGPNAPAWLQKMNNIMDWISTSLSFVVGASAMWLGEKIANGVIHGLELLTTVAQGVSNGVMGVLNTNLQKEMNELELKMDWQEVLIGMFTKATEDNSRRLEKATDSWSSGNQKLIDVMMENATIRSRIAKNMV